MLIRSSNEQVYCQEKRELSVIGHFHPWLMHRITPIHNLLIVSNVHMGPHNTLIYTTFPLPGLIGEAWQSTIGYRLVTRSCRSMGPALRTSDTLTRLTSSVVRRGWFWLSAVWAQTASVKARAVSHYHKRTQSFHSPSCGNRLIYCTAQEQLQ